MSASDGIEYANFEDLPVETPVQLTKLWDDDGRYADYGPGMFCSPEGKNSLRRARSELWAVRHKPRDDKTGAVWFYCLDHLPSREWIAGEDTYRVRTNEITCTDCFLVVPVGTTCDATGRVHSS